MNYKFKKVIVIGLGGSIFYPEDLDADFLKKFRQFLKPFFKKHRFVIVTGGGRLARIFMAGAAAAGPVSDIQKDWLGIYATRLNAQLWQTVFGKEADPEIIVGQPKNKDLKYPITLSSGWTPGWSTDYVAAALAEHFGAGIMVSAGKPAYVYPVRGRSPQGDRSHSPSAKAASNGIYSIKDETLDEKHPFAMMTWREYRRLIPKKWKPGDHSPVDPVAAQFCDQKKVDAIVVRGDDFANLGNLLNGREFKGTIIK